MCELGVPQVRNREYAQAVHSRCGISLKLCCWLSNKAIFPALLQRIHWWLQWASKALALINFLHVGRPNNFVEVSGFYLGTKTQKQRRFPSPSSNRLNNCSSLLVAYFVISLITLHI